MRKSPSNFPVEAGFSVSGEAKNWEKLGSWPSALIIEAQNINKQILGRVKYKESGRLKT
jgi:hypothetical protein